jgi:hypothetical protein
MTVPAFTAETSLYKTSGHHRTGQHRITPSAQSVSPVWPAAKAEGEGEVINVHGCPPGYSMWEAGGEWGCDLVEPPTGGPQQPPDETSGTGRGDGGGGGGGRGGGKAGGPSPDDRRKQRCQLCESNANNCVDQATLAGSACLQNSRKAVQALCNPPNFVDPWGAGSHAYIWKSAHKPRRLGTLKNSGKTIGELVPVV